MEPNPNDSASESGLGGYSPVQEIAAAPPVRQKNHLRRALIGSLVGVVVIGYSQWTAPGSDHQMANFTSIMIGLVTLLFVAYQLFRLFARQGRGFVVPVVGTLIVGILILLFRFDGFSGEMVPQFKTRFGSPRPELRAVLENDAETVIEASDTAQSLGFLGTDRTGTIAKREFEVPTDASMLEVQWDQGIGEGWSSFAVSAGRAVTLEQREDQECVTCYRLADGELLWMQSHLARHLHALGGVGPRSTPTIVGDRVYAQGATGRVWCLNLSSGEIIWTADLLEMAGWDQLASEVAVTWGRAGSPLIVNDLCVLPYGGPAANAQTGRSLVALDIQNGKVRWAAGEDQISYGSPGLMTLAGKTQIVAVNEPSVTGHEIDNGEVLWRFEWPGQSNGGANCAMAIQVDANRFVIGKGYGGGSALVKVQAAAADQLSAEAVWQSVSILKTKFTHACIAGDVAYAISNGSLEAVDVKDGERLWTQPRSSRFGQGQILLVEDVLVGQSESGEVVFVSASPDEYQELLRLPTLSAKTWNIPTVAGRYLLVRNDRQAVCYLLPARR